MTSRDFCYWLQGYFEISGEKTMSGEQMEMVKRHLAMVFAHEIDPAMGGAGEQAKLTALHNQHLGVGLAHLPTNGAVPKC
jgi:hypothetical protein